jgi:1,4-alpha-glucan branching enzyme
MAKKTPDTKVSRKFALTAPEAASVMLVGDFTHWQKSPISLHKQSNGVWSVSVPIEPGEHRYRFLVDGQWRDDPECTLRVPNPYGSHDAVVRVG